MKIGDAFRHAKNAFMASLAGRYEDQPRRLKGDVFMELRNAYTGALEGKWHRRRR